MSTSSVEEAAAAGFWLPSDFLTDDDFLMDRHNLNTAGGSHSQFPCLSDNRRLEKLWVVSTSPQSTLPCPGSWARRSSVGSSNGSPDAVPFGAKRDAVGDLIYRAAGEVAKLRLNRGDGFGPGHAKDKGLVLPPRSLPQFYPEVDNLNNPYAMQKQQCGRAVGRTGQALWVPQQNPSRRSSVLLGGDGGGGAAAARMPRAGTGVFLPRRYGNNSNSNAYSSGSHKKLPGCSNALSPVPAQTKSFNYLNGSARTQPIFAPSQPQSQPLMEMGSFLDYDSLMARRQAIVVQKRRSLLLASLVEGRDLYLPHDWTY